LEQEEQASSMVSASSRAYGENVDLCPDLDRVDQLNAPLLEAQPLYLGAGERPLHLAWKGGYGPYAVTLVRNADSVTLLAAADLRSTSFSAEPLALEPGAYTLSIEDIGGLRVEALVSVVEPGALPLPLGPEAEELAVLPERVSGMIVAAHLAALASQGYGLEAFQRVAPLAEDEYQPAQVLARALACGSTSRTLAPLPPPRPVE
ncbi:MAG: hypothetical protein D6E12_12065, partial [Desulfovibrio sp.]